MTRGHARGKKPDILPTVKSFLFARGLALCGALLASTAPRTSAAQTQQGAPRPSGAEADRQALALYEEGSAAFNAEDYSTAAARFEAAYNLSPRPRILYNLGLTYDRLGIPQQAIDAYERFLSMQPNAREREQVEERIRVLRAEADMAQERAQQEHSGGQGSNNSGGNTIVTERVIVRPPEPPHTARTVGIVLGSLSLASVGASVAVYFYAQNYYNQLRRECGDLRRDVTNTPWCPQTAINDLQLRATLTNGLIATAIGLGVAAGVAIGIDLAQSRPASAPPPRRPPRARVRGGSVVPTAEGVTLVVGGTF